MRIEALSVVEATASYVDVAAPRANPYAGTSHTEGRAHAGAGEIES